MSTPIKLRSIPLFTPQWGEAELRKRHAQEERSFERGFRMRAHSDSELSFPAYTNCRTLGGSIGEIIRSDWPKVTGVDLASKKRPGTCLVTVALDPVRRRRFPIDVRYGAWRSNETCEQLADVNDRFNPTVIMVEDNAYQAALIEWIQALPERYAYWMKVEPTTTTEGTKASAELGLPVMQTEFRSKAWVFPWSEWEGARTDDPYPRGHWARLDYEFRQHPIASTSDGVMATWFARQGIEIWLSRLLSNQQDNSLGDLTAR